MPLVHGKSDKAISENISRLSHEGKGRSRAQIIAIAYSVAGRSKKKKK